MTQTDLFQCDMDKWASDQLEKLDLKPGDVGYDGARQAAECGWPADKIRPLIWPTQNPG